MTATMDEGPKQPHLAKQDATTVDASKLTALSPEVVRYDDQLSLRCASEVALLTSPLCCRSLVKLLSMSEQLVTWLMVNQP